MADEKVNYTDEMVAEMTKRYLANPGRSVVEEIAKDFGKSFRSVVAKLSREGVYQAEPRVSKDGSPVIRKEQLVETIESQLGISVPSLVKASKLDLKKVVESLETYSDESTDEAVA